MVVKIQFNLSLDGIAKLLRNYAELTANNSKNWENYEVICKDSLQQVLDHGKELAGNPNDGTTPNPSLIMGG